MKLTELRGKTVVSVAEAWKVGVVEGVLVDMPTRQLRGLRIRPEGRGPEYVVAREQIRGIGPDAVTVASEAALQSPEQARELARVPSLTDLLGSRVVTESGTILGTIADVNLDPASGQVQSVEYDGGPFGGLLGRRHTFDAKEIVGVGPGVVTVTEAARPTRAA